MLFPRCWFIALICIGIRVGFAITPIFNYPPAKALWNALILFPPTVNRSVGDPDNARSTV